MNSHAHNLSPQQELNKSLLNEQDVLVVDCIMRSLTYLGKHLLRTEWVTFVKDKRGY